MYTLHERTTPKTKIFGARYAIPGSHPIPSHHMSRSDAALMPTNLALGDGPDPAQGQVDQDGDDADDPNGLFVIGALVAEDDGEDDAAHVADAAGAAGDDAVGVRVDVGDEAEDGAVGALEEEGHAGDEAEHGALVVAVGETDGDLEGAGDDGVGVHEVLLAPDAGAGVDGVGEETAEGAEDDVQETEHGGPATGAGLTEGFEVLEVVGTEDGVDRQFGAEGAEVAAAGDEGLEGEDDGHCFLEAGFADDFAAGDIEHLLFAHLSFVVKATLALAGGVVLDFCVRVPARRTGRGRRWLIGTDLPWNLDDVTGDAVFSQILLGGEVAFAPFSCWGVGADQEQSDGDGDDDDEWDNERHSPCLVGSQVLMRNQRVEDGGHQEVCDTATRIAEACGERVARANNVLIKEASRPYLARHKATAKDTNEETESQ